MDKAQKRIFDQARRLVRFGSENPSLQSDTFYQKVNQKLIQIVSHLDKLYKNQNLIRTRKSTSKKHSRQELESVCLQVANLLKGYGNFYEFTPFASLKGFGKNQLYKYSGINLLINSEKLKEIIDQYPLESKEAKVGDSVKQEFLMSIASFEELLDMPTRTNQNSKDCSKQIREGLKQYQNLLNDVILPYVRGKYEKDNNDLIESFERVLKSDKIARRKISLAGRITDSEGKPIHRPRVAVDKKKPMIKRGKKGNYFIKNLTGGIHTLQFSCHEYETVEKKVLITKSSVYRLDVVMKRNSEPLSVSNDQLAVNCKE